MADQDAFDTLMARLRAGDDDAATAVFRRFSHRLMALARGRLESTGQAREEAEDVIQSVYRSFFTRFRGGQFAFDDWDDLWGLLTLITLRKCTNRRAYHRALRRDPRRSGARPRPGSSGDPGLGLIDREPTPLEAAALADTIEELLRGMGEADREAVVMLIQGYTAEEIALARSCSERTVRRVRSRMKHRLRQIYEA